MRKILKIIYLIILLLLLWNLFFDREGIVSYIRMRGRKNRLIEEINALKARKTILLHKKEFIESREGLETILILRFGKIDNLKGGK